MREKTTTLLFDACAQANDHHVLVSHFWSAAKKKLFQRNYYDVVLLMCLCCTVKYLQSTDFVSSFSIPKQQQKIACGKCDWIRIEKGWKRCGERGSYTKKMLPKKKNNYETENVFHYMQTSTQILMHIKHNVWVAQKFGTLTLDTQKRREREKNEKKILFRVSLTSSGVNSLIFEFSLSSQTDAHQLNEFYLTFFFLQICSQIKR